MSPTPSKSLPVTETELDAARLGLVRQRLIVFGYVVGALILLLVGVRILGIQWLKRSPRDAEIVALFASALVGVVVMIVPQRRARNRQWTLKRLVRRTQVMVVMAVISQLQGMQHLAGMITQALQPMGFRGNIGPALPMYLFFGLVHFSASVVMPWTWREAFRPVLVVALVTGALSLAAQNDSWNFRLLGFLLAFAVGMPGVLLSWIKAGGVREILTLRLIGGKYQEVEHELSLARRIHERLFPKGIDEGPVRVAYAYEPMRQIGGDYLDLAKGADGSVTHAVIDVTGHGVAAALAVHRLHGELKRVMGQQPTPGPAQIARALNEYVLLTLAEERVFATAVLVRMEPSGKAALCVAGHPSPLVVRDDRVEVVDSTAMMLGVFPVEAFEAEERTITLEPGESIVLYTDGATEAADVKGRQLGTEGLRKLVLASRSLRGELLARAVMEGVSRYRSGPPQDDTLVVCVSRVETAALA